MTVCIESKEAGSGVLLGMTVIVYGRTVVVNGKVVSVNGLVKYIVAVTLGINVGRCVGVRGAKLGIHRISPTLRKSLV